MKHGKFLSNVHNPHLPNGRLYFCYSFDAIDKGPAAMEAEWQEHLNWIDSNVIDRPQASEAYTVEELEKMGLVGIYKKEVENDNS